MGWVIITLEQIAKIGWVIITLEQIAKIGWVIFTLEQIRKIGWVIIALEAKVGQFLLGYKCLVRQGIVVREQDQLGDIPAVLFLQNILQLHQKR
jgi:hypothetical protein